MSSKKHPTSEIRRHGVNLEWYTKSIEFVWDLESIQRVIDCALSEWGLEKVFEPQSKNWDFLELNIRSLIICMCISNRVNLKGINIDKACVMWKRFCVCSSVDERERSKKGIEPWAIAHHILRGDNVSHYTMMEVILSLVFSHMDISEPSEGDIKPKHKVN
ncbi:hypothetical protein K435DRAFT_804530 [Dendrothele bispora CBS 962.96]|uniref:Uncharacterized protein n=1 Tax=Dendrothele bispora (strain CBS 962.96) TaxID=1314807 RepID=A0A4S8LEG6_DENBC|nr:hypothetical protein K435DRAFT_804530 [Dendrothele bispora CBS 962.96]